MTKVTMATIKSFIRRNEGKLYIRCKSTFDGMVDGVRPVDGKPEFTPAQPGAHAENSMGINGAWFVGGSRDYLTPISENGFVGFHVYNCCGSFDIAVRA